jgi:hypothetical protein
LDALTPRNGAISGDFETCHTARAAGEAFGLNAHPLQHRDEQIAQRRIVVGPEDEVLSVPESASSEENREVRIIVNVRVAHVAAIEHHGMVEQPLSALLLAR